MDPKFAVPSTIHIPVQYSLFGRSVLNHCNLLFR